MSALEIIKNKLDTIEKEYLVLLNHKHYTTEYKTLLTHQYNAMKVLLEEIIEEIEAQT